MRSDLAFWSGADRNRTDDLLLAKQVLYQLSYRPSAPRSRNATSGPRSSFRPRTHSSLGFKSSKSRVRYPV